MKTVTRKMYRSVLGATLLMVAVIGLFSCSKKVGDWVPDTATKQRYSAQKSGAMIAPPKGWKVCGDIDQTPLGDKKTTCGTAPIRVPLTQDFMHKMGYNLSDSWENWRLRDMFKVDGYVPDGVYLNHETGTYTSNCRSEILKYITPSVMVEIGDVKVSANTYPSTEATVEFNQILHSESPSDGTYRVSYKVGRTARWTKTESSSFSHGLGFEVPLNIGGASGKIGSNIVISAGAENQRGVDNCDEVTVEQSIHVAVEKGKKVRVVAILNKHETTVSYTGTAKLTGWVAVNFAYPILGHYFHFMRAENFSSKIIPPQHRTESGTVVVQHSYTGHIYVSEMVDVNAPDPSIAGLSDYNKQIE